MQKVIAKYGLAAHLAILVAAPLFLFPFFDGTTIACVWFWLMVPAALWLVLEPSIRGSEQLHNARQRVARQIVGDPYFWSLLALIVFAGIRALNVGIELVYDAEKSVWHVSDPKMPLFPGAVGDAGLYPFASVLALAILTLSARHALGRSARMAFLLVSSALAGLAGILSLLLSVWNYSPLATAAIRCADGSYAYLGLTFGLHLLAATVALVGAFENKWRLALSLSIVGIAGSSMGLFAYAPSYLMVGVLACEVVVLAYSFAYGCRVLPAAGELKMLVFLGISFAIGGLLVAVLVPQDLQTERLTDFLKYSFFTSSYWETRSVLSSVAFKAWISHLWIGTGLSSFQLDFRFYAQQADWLLLPRGAASIPFGWWRLLAERGLVGMVFFVLPLVFLLFSYFRRLFLGYFGTWGWLHPVCLLGFFGVALIVASGFFDCSMTMPTAILESCAFLSLATASFPKIKKEKHG